MIVPLSENFNGKTQRISVGSAAAKAPRSTGAAKRPGAKGKKRHGPRGEDEESDDGDDEGREVEYMSDSDLSL